MGKRKAHIRDRELLKVLSNPRRILDDVDHDVLRVRGLFLIAPLFNAVPVPAEGPRPALVTGVSAQGWKGGNSFNFIFMHNIIDYLSFSYRSVVESEVGVIYPK
jgi:hypothetical protein